MEVVLELSGGGLESQWEEVLKPSGGGLESSGRRFWSPVEEVWNPVEEVWNPVGGGFETQWRRF